MACRQCQRCGARWIEGQLYWATGKTAQELDLAGLVCNNANDPACLNPFKGAMGGDTWEQRAGLTQAFLAALDEQRHHQGLPGGESC